MEDPGFLRMGWRHNHHEMLSFDTRKSSLLLLSIDYAQRNFTYWIPSILPTNIFWKFAVTEYLQTTIMESHCRKFFR